MNNSDIGDISLLAECNTLCVKMLSSEHDNSSEEKANHRLLACSGWYNSLMTPTKRI